MENPPEIITPSNQDLTIRQGKVKVAGVKYWDAEYIRDRMGKIDNLNHRIMFAFLWYTGVRITEAINVTKDSLDFINFTATIRWQKHKKKKGPWLTRNIALYPDLKTMLEIFVSSLKAKDRIFPMTRQRAWQLSTRYFGGNPHMFRHSFAVNWLRHGGDIFILSKMLGHSDIKNTMVYLDIVLMDVGRELLKIQF